MGVADEPVKGAPTESGTTHAAGSTYGTESRGASAPTPGYPATQGQSGYQQQAYPPTGYNQQQQQQPGGYYQSPPENASYPPQPQGPGAVQGSQPGAYNNSQQDRQSVICNVQMILFIVGFIFPALWFFGCALRFCRGVQPHERIGFICNLTAACIAAVVIVLGSIFGRRRNCTYQDQYGRTYTGHC